MLYSISSCRAVDAAHQPCTQLWPRPLGAANVLVLDVCVEVVRLRVSLSYPARGIVCDESGKSVEVQLPHRAVVLCDEFRHTRPFFPHHTGFLLFV